MENLFDIEGRAAIVTGASSGLGRHFALTLARAGAKVAVMARRAGNLDALVAEIEAKDGRAVPIPLDVTDPDSIREAVAAAETELGPIAILVNNAGVAVTKPVLDVQESDWDKVMDTNLKGAWLMAQEVARHMTRLGHGGSIINIVSITAFRIAGHLSVYAASKAALMQLTRSMALELARENVRVNAIAPGYVLTDINREFFETPAGERMIRRVPQGRIGRPEDLDGALLLLASDASAYMTGSAIVVDGGHLQVSL